MPGNLPSTPPANVLESWPAPNYIDPPTRNWIPYYAIALHVLASAFACLRYGLRTKNLIKTAGLDDACFLGSWLCATAFVALAVYSSLDKLIDRHIWDVLPSKYAAEALNAWLASVVFLVGTCLLKLSVLFFYRRIRARTYSRCNKIAIYLAVAFTVMYSLALVLALIFNCHPTQAYWLSYNLEWSATHEFSCANTEYLNLVAGAFSIVSDLYAVLLPCVMVQGLQMSRREKIGLNIVFAIGLVTVVAAVGRTWSFHELAVTYDLTWTGFWVDFWAILEFELGIICACLPSLRGCLVRCMAGARRKSRRQNSGMSSHRLRPMAQGICGHNNPGYTQFGDMSASVEDDTRQHDRPQAALALVKPQVTRGEKQLLDGSICTLDNPNQSTERK